MVQGTIPVLDDHAGVFFRVVHDLENRVELVRKDMPLAVGDVGPIQYCGDFMFHRRGPQLLPSYGGGLLPSYDFHETSCLIRTMHDEIPRDHARRFHEKIGKNVLIVGRKARVRGRVRVVPPSHDARVPEVQSPGVRIGPVRRFGPQETMDAGPTKS